MHPLALSAVCTIMGAQLPETLSSQLEGLLVRGVSTDSRNLQAGDLFIALTGPHFDGHDHLAEAIRKGAVGVVVAADSPVSASMMQETPWVYLLVESPLKALGQLAAYVRSEAHCPVVGLTGSVGKTTTKAMIASILKQVSPRVLATEGTLNNEIGVPLTLLKLTPQHDYAVIEMGTNHWGEIRYLSQLVRPDIALITCTGEAHLEHFQDVAGVARAKAEIFEGLSAAGTAVLNSDDRSFDTCRRACLNASRMISFGESESADVRAVNVEQDVRGCASFDLLLEDKRSISIRLTLLGRHQVSNALAASAVAVALGVSLKQIQQGLADVSIDKHRVHSVKGWQSAEIIDDTYNANPVSVRGAIDLLAARTSKKILVLGNMGELGEHAVEHHRALGQYAKQAGVDALYTVGVLAAHAAAAFGENATAFDETEKTTVYTVLKSVLDANTVVLVKGSRAMQMETIVDALQEKTKTV